MWALDPVEKTSFTIGGIVGDYLRGCREQWLKPAPAANPAMLEMFRDRNRLPRRELVPWAGEFAGKYLTGAVGVFLLAGDDDLHARLRAFVDEWLTLQAEDGYLGPWPDGCKLTGRAPGADGDTRTWDAWGHYHAMLGLLAWGAPVAQAAAERVADLLCRRFLGDTQERLVDTGNTDKNLAPAHALVLLYRRTGEERYLELARQIVAEFAEAGDWLRQALAGREFWEMPLPRWESLHSIQALAELAELDDDADCRTAFTRLWESMRRGDRHNNGGFTSGEKATGDPYHPGAIETCCTIAWAAMSLDMLRLTGRSDVADELELTLLNSVLGMHSASGRWCTYNTPMDGVREASAHTIVFQARAGQPELNCCSVNAARGFGLLADWAVMRHADGIYLNYYGAGKLVFPAPDGALVTVTQVTEYPAAGTVSLRLEAANPVTFPLHLRIPRWSRQTPVTVNGEPVEGARPGTYLRIERRWQTGDRVDLALDFSLHAWYGRGRCAGQASLYRGPVLLSWDRRYNTVDPDDVPAVDPASLVLVPATWPHWLPPHQLWQAHAVDGSVLNLVDFASAGEGGTPYRSWLPLAPGAKPLPEFFAPAP